MWLASLNGTIPNHSLSAASGSPADEDLSALDNELLTDIVIYTLHFLDGEGKSRLKRQLKGANFFRHSGVSRHT